MKRSKTPAPCPTASHVIVILSSCLRSLIVFLEHCVPQWYYGKLKLARQWRHTKTCRQHFTSTSTHLHPRVYLSSIVPQLTSQSSSRVPSAAERLIHTEFLALFQAIFPRAITGLNDGALLQDAGRDWSIGIIPGRSSTTNSGKTLSPG